jgi:hypothetical protein
MTNNFELKSAVSNYLNNSKFTAYGQITIWIGGCGYSSTYPYKPNVLLTDNMDKVKSRLVQLGQFASIQLKLCTTNEMIEPNENNWNDGAILKSEDTILSSQLYKNDRVIMGRFNIEEV